MGFTSFGSTKVAIMNLLDRKLVNLIAMVMAYVCLIWGTTLTIAMRFTSFLSSRFIIATLVDPKLVNLTSVYCIAAF